MTKLTQSERRLKKVYGLEPVDYNDILESQNGVCAICKKPETASNQWGPRRLAVDHCHVSGEIRGLLCGKCNSALGRFNDDLELLENAVKYMKHPNNRRERLLLNEKHTRGVRSSRAAVDKVDVHATRGGSGGSDDASQLEIRELSQEPVAGDHDIRRLVEE